MKIIKPSKEDCVPLSFLHRTMQRGRVGFSVQPVCLCGRIYQQTSSHAIIWRPQEALISGGEKGRLLHISLLCVWVCSIELKVNSFSDKHTHKYSLSLSHSHLLSEQFSFLAVLVEIEKEKRFSKHLELLCNGGNVMHYIKTFSLNFWRGMYLKKECNAVFRLLTS